MGPNPKCSSELMKRFSLSLSLSLIYIYIYIYIYKRICNHKYVTLKTTFGLLQKKKKNNIWILYSPFVTLTWHHIFLDFRIIFFLRILKIILVNQLFYLFYKFKGANMHFLFFTNNYLKNEWNLVFTHFLIYYLLYINEMEAWIWGGTELCQDLHLEGAMVM